MDIAAVFSYVGLLTLLGSVTVSGENGFVLEKIANEGLDFRDLAERARLTDFSNISSGCNEQLRSLLDENQHALWQMADAWSKFPYPGALFYSSKRDYGNYDECLKVDVKTERQRVIGKYCPWGFRLPDLRPNQSLPVFLLAYCVPDKCSADDLNKILGLSLPIFNENYCSTKETDSELDAGAIVSIVIFLMIFVFMVFSTVYDAYLYYADKKCSHPIFKAFSMYDNGKKLLQYTRHTQGGEQILCFHGMKFISMWWIISGHGTIASFLAPALNEDDRAGWQGKRYSQYIATAHISVDTFFYISGFLMAYLYFKNEISKKSVVEQVKVVPSMILHRYLRLTPAITACFLGSVYLLKYTQEGPFSSYGLRTGLIEPCKKYWWTYFLYIQNYYNYHYGESLCIPTTWYLSADMQLFLITPLIIIPISVLYRRSFRNTMAALTVLNLIFLGIPIFTKLHWQHYDPDFNEYDFHSKLISYFIGVMMGIYMRHEKHKTIAISKTVNVVMWFLSLGTMLAVMFYRQDVQMKDDYVSRSLCYSFTRPMWCLALSWITFACVKGYGGPINWFLSCSFMQLGSKLTYCIYVVHGMLIYHYAISERGKIYFSDWNLFVQNCSYFVVSVLIAAVWSLAFELPMITIERLVFGGTPKPAKPKVDGPQQSEHPVAA